MTLYRVEKASVKAMRVGRGFGICWIARRKEAVDDAVWYWYEAA